MPAAAVARLIALTIGSSANAQPCGLRQANGRTFGRCWRPNAATACSRIVSYPSLMLTEAVDDRPHTKELMTFEIEGLGRQRLADVMAGIGYVRMRKYKR